MGVIEALTCGGRTDDDYIVHRRRLEVEAVRGISFDVAEGELFGLLGPNGAARRRRSRC